VVTSQTSVRVRQRSTKRFASQRLPVEDFAVSQLREQRQVHMNIPFGNVVQLGRTACSQRGFEREHFIRGNRPEFGDCALEQRLSIHVIDVQIFGIGAGEEPCKALVGTPEKEFPNGRSGDHVIGILFHEFRVPDPLFQSCLVLVGIRQGEEPILKLAKPNSFQ
jgi:hypothetical protein